MPSDFSRLLDQLVEQSNRRAVPVAAPAVRRQPSPGGFDPAVLRRSPDRALAKALNAGIKEANETVSETLLRGLRPGMGVRCEGRAGGFQVVDIDANRRRVQVRQVQDSPHPNVNFDAPVPTWIDVDAAERAPEFDAPDAAGGTFAKALGAANDRRTRQENILAIRDRGRALAVETRGNLLKALESGSMSPADVRRGEIMLNTWCARMGL